jgi:protein tyrosine/serine phosphatase
LALINREAVGIIWPMTRMSTSRGAGVTTGKCASWIAGLLLAGFLLYAPYLYYRFTLEHSKRLRTVADGKLYRSGCLTADGFRDAIQRFKIKTVISFWDEDPDPTLRNSRFDATAIKESDLCASLGVKYKFIYVELVPEAKIGTHRPPAIDEFFKIMDDPESHPVLIHCKAGLHRTGVMAAVYRMEYDGWSRQDAMRELKANGFGHFGANSANPYVDQYVMRFKPRRACCDDCPPPAARAQRP